MFVFGLIVVLSLYVRFVPENNLLIHNKLDMNTVDEFYDLDGDDYIDRFVDHEGRVYNSQGIRIYENRPEQESDK